MTEQQVSEQVDPNAPPASTSYVFKVVEMLDDVGRRIVQRQIVFGVAPADFVEFVGIGQISIQAGPGPAQPSSYRFPIENVTSIEEAFAKWDVLCQRYGEVQVDVLRRRIAAAQRNDRIVVPTAEARRLVVPD